MTLVPADQHFALLAVLISAAAFGLWAERTRFGSHVSSAVIAIAVTLILSNTGVIPDSAPVYDVVWSYLLPLAIPLLLFKADLRRILRDSGPTLIAYTFGAIGTILGSVVAFLTVPLGPEGWKLAGIFCATYIGGSLNYYGAAAAVDLPSGTLLTAGVAADNLMMALYFVVLFALPSMVSLKKRFHQREGITADGTAVADHYWDQRDLKLIPMAQALAVSGVACALGYGLQSWTGWSGTGILFVTAMVVTVATLFPRTLGRIEGADVIGTFLMQIFFATIGAAANLWKVLEVGPSLLLFAAIILAIHLAFILIGGKLAKLDLREIVIASNANMGGATTAAAMAVARRWDALVIPAVLCGTLGYAIATFLGVMVARLLE